MKRALVSVVMGSQSDYATVKPGVQMLRELEIPYEANVVSAHRTPAYMAEFAASAESRGIQVFLAAAGGAAHLPGMVAAHTILPVLGIPIPATVLQGIDALLSIVQMPKGVPVGTLAIGSPGAVNAAILAAQILALHDPALRERLRAKRERSRSEVMSTKLEEEGEL